MNADGVSLPTTLSQMGKVARTQVKSQQQATAVTPYNEREENKDDLKLKKVREMEKAAKERVEADRREEKDRRKRRRLARRNKDEELHEDVSGAEPDDSTQEDADALGVTIDIMA